MKVQSCGAWLEIVRLLGRQINYKKEEFTRKRVHKPERPAPAAVETRAGRKAAMGANVATVPACAPSANREI